MTKLEKIFFGLTDILLLILILYPVLQGGIVGGYDPGFHMSRIHTLATNISSGHFPNPIGMEYLDKLGYGIGFFYGNFLIYPFAILNILGMTTYHSYMVMIFVFTLLSILSINFVTHDLFHNPIATIISGPIYLTSNYFIGLIYFRAAIGELMAFAIIPWALLAIIKIIKGKTNYFWMLGISFSLLLVSHVLSFLLISATALLLFIFNIVPIFKKISIFWAYVKGALLFLGLSAVYLLPFIEQYTTQKYVNTAVMPDGSFQILNIGVWMQSVLFDLKQSFTINSYRILILFIFITAYYLIKGIYRAVKTKDWHLKDPLTLQLWIIILAFGSIVFSYPLLQQVIKYFPQLALMQASTRVMVIVLPLLTLLSANALGELIQHAGKFKVPAVSTLFAAIAIITVIYPIRSNLDFVSTRKGPINELSISMGEYEPAAFMEYNVGRMMQVNPQYLANQEKYHITKNDHHQTDISIAKASNKRTYLLPKLYYKGYQVTMKYNNKTVTKPTLAKNGLTAIRLPNDFKAGTLSMKYRLTNMAKLGWLISILTVVSTLGFEITKRIKNKNKQNKTAEIKE